MCTEMLHTWPEAHCGILCPFLPDHCISPIRAEVREERAIIYGFIPVIPEMIWLMILPESESGILTLRLSHFHPYPHRQPERQTAFHRFCKVGFGSL
jgi:hypothetical protein